MGNSEIESLIRERAFGSPRSRDRMMGSFHEGGGLEGIGFSFYTKMTDIPSCIQTQVEMVVVYAGSCRRTINGYVSPMRAGDACLSDGNSSRSFDSFEEGTILVACGMSKDFIKDEFISRLSGNGVFSRFFAQELYSQARMGSQIFVRPRDPAKVVALIGDMLVEFFSDSGSSRTVLCSYLSIVFHELAKSYVPSTESERAAAASGNGRIADILAYAERNCVSANLKATAHDFGMHPTYLSAFVKNATGRNYSEILQDERLRRACYLLQNSDMPAVLVAQSVGYSNVSFFYRLFTSRYCCTPREYRKRMGVAVSA